MAAMELPALDNRFLKLLNVAIKVENGELPEFVLKAKARVLYPENWKDARKNAEAVK